MIDLHLTLLLLLELALTALVAGFIDTLAGGGGLIVIPVLMLCQLPPVIALATNKLQASAGTFMSTLTLWHKGKIESRAIRRPFCYAFIGAVFGTWLIQHLDTRVVGILVPVVLTIIALYFLLAPGAGKVERKPRISNTLYTRIVVPIIGFYDGFFGPGTGSFFSLAEVSLRGRQLVAATANAKALNLASNVGALLFFIFSGKVVWSIGLAMMVGQLIGAYLGAHAVILGGNRLIRPIIVIVSLSMLARYGWQHL